MGAIDGTTLNSCVIEVLWLFKRIKIRIFLGLITVLLVIEPGASDTSLFVRNLKSRSSFWPGFNKMPPERVMQSKLDGRGTLPYATQWLSSEAS